jgi:hypothetical protein
LAQGLFGVDKKKNNSIRIIRDKAAFHFDKLNLAEAASALAEHENSIYLAQHPANSLYYVGSSLVFRTIFALIADNILDTNQFTHDQRVHEGFRIAIDDAKKANWHLHIVLYGLIQQLFNMVIGRSLTELESTRIRVQNAPDPDHVGIPTFIEIGSKHKAS